MSYRGFVPSAVVTAIVVGTLISCSVADQASETDQSGSAAWTPPRTPWDEPDLQGVWRYERNTPLERPVSLAGSTELTDAEVAERQEVQDELAAKRLAGADYEQLNRLPRGDDGQPTRDDPRATIAGAEYNAFWQDRARARHVDSRTALIVDPPDGRMPVRDELKRQDIRGWQARLSSRGLSGITLPASSIGSQSIHTIPSGMCGSSTTGSRRSSNSRQTAGRWCWPWVRRTLRAKTRATSTDRMTSRSFPTVISWSPMAAGIGVSSSFPRKAST